MQKTIYIRYKPKFTGMDVGINSVSSIVLGNVEPPHGDQVGNVNSSRFHQLHTVGNWYEPDEISLQRINPRSVSTYQCDITHLTCAYDHGYVMFTPVILYSLSMVTGYHINSVTLL